MAFFAHFLPACMLSLGLMTTTTLYAAPATPTTIQEFQRVSQMDKLLDQSIEQSRPVFMELANNKVKEYSKSSQLNTAQQQAATDIAELIYQQNLKQFQQLNFKNNIETIFQNTFSEEELRAAIKFYQSPEGQSILAKTPIMMQKINQLVIAHLQQNNSLNNQALNEKVHAILKGIEK